MKIGVLILFIVLFTVAFAASGYITFQVLKKNKKKDGNRSGRSAQDRKNV